MLPLSHSFPSMFVLIILCFNYTNYYISLFIARPIWIAKSFSPLNGYIQFAGTFFMSIFPSAYCNSMVLNSLSHSKCTLACPRSEDPNECFSVLLSACLEMFISLSIFTSTPTSSTPDHHFSSQYFSEHSRREIVVGAASDLQTSFEKTRLISPQLMSTWKGKTVQFLFPVVSEGN